jgi:hypothetical protein
MLWRNLMAYVQANSLRLPCTSIHSTPREKMIERAQLYQDTLKSSKSKNVQHCEGPYILIMAETYRLCHCRLRQRLRPTTAATTPTPTQTPKPRASRRCQWQSPNPPPQPRCAGGAWGRRGSEPGPCRACPSRFA